MLIDEVGRRCCGCRACLQACAAEAISFENDDFGFEYPHIDYERCLNCGRCGDVCPVLDTGCENSDICDTELCGAARAKTSEIRAGGSSGGLFGLFAKKVIEDGGAVFGAAFDGNLKLKTSEAEDMQSLKPLLKSKYLLCDTTGAFSKIKDAANSGKPVLYCSSPCQTQALKNYLGKEYDNVMLVDFVCHGVGNQEMFDKSVRWFEEKHKKKLSNFTFRFKDAREATSHYYKATFSDGSESAGMYFGFPYYNAYCKQLACRDICYECPFASKTRVSDITIGDFHTAERYIKNINRMAGISMFVCNTQKGKRFIEALKDKLDIWEMPPEILYTNNRFSGVTGGMSGAILNFRNSFLNYGYGKETQKILNPMSDKPKKIFYKMPKSVRKLLKHIMEL